MRALLFITCMVGASSASAATVFVCPSPKGYAFYPSDKSPTWGSDGLRGWEFEITFDDDQLADVKIRKDLVSKSLKSEGAEFVPVFSMARDRYPAMVVIYPNDGILETYAVSQDRGQFKLLWTTTRSGRLSGQTTKVGAYTAPCRRR